MNVFNLDSFKKSQIDLGKDYDYFSHNGDVLCMMTDEEKPVLEIRDMNDGFKKIGEIDIEETDNNIVRLTESG